MNRIAKYFSFLVVLGACTQPKVIVLTNPSDFDRNDEVIVINRADFEANYEVAGDSFSYIFTDGTDTLPCQFDDINADGKWDEIAFAVNLPAKQTKNISVSKIPNVALPKYKKSAQVALFVNNEKVATDKFDWHETPEAVVPPDHKPGKWPQPFQSEGPMWENDKVAFRHYFDVRSGRDIFGKKTSEMMLHEIGAEPKLRSYHKMQPWGMDVLKTGSSLGAGAVALLSSDSIYPIGQTKLQKYNEVFDGPVRARLRLTYNGWNAGSDTLDLIEDIEIEKGKYYYKNTLTITGTDKVLNPIAGITTLKLHDKSFYYDNIASKVTVIATYDSQTVSEVDTGSDHHLLGMAILAPTAQVKGTGHAPDQSTDKSAVISTYYLTLKTKTSVPVSYYFVAGWERSNPQFLTKKGFIDYTELQAKRLAEPIGITYQELKQ